MKKKLWLTGLFALTITVCLAAFDGLSGDWTGDLVTSTYSLTLTYHFKVDGEKLSGTVDGPDGSVSIDSGSFKNNLLKFSITIPSGDVLSSTGRYYGDSTTVDFPLRDQKVHIKLHRGK